MAQDRVFISPGVFTSERDLTFVQRQVGVTTLGLVGETTKGPAFQPIFVSNYDEFKSFFGGLNPKKVKDTGAPLYELPYIAKSYLSQSNQLYVTRVLGLSGYDAGPSWGITLDAAMDTSTTGVTVTATNYNPLISYTFDTGGTPTSIIISDPTIDELNTEGLIDLTFLATAGTGDTATLNPTFYKITETGNIFSGASYTLEVIAAGTDTSGNTTGITSGVTVHYSGSSYTEVENQIVAVLRSRGFYDGDEILNFEVTGTSLNFSTTATTALTNPLATFILTGSSATQGAFEYSLSFDKTKKNYITRVLGKESNDGNTAIFVEELYQNMLDDLITDEKVRGINLNIINYGLSFDDYKDSYQAAVTPYLVSEVRGNKVIRLFRFWTISDGNAANKEFKISIVNIKPDDKEFDVVIRAFDDTDANPVVLERFTRCTMDRNSDNFVGRRIGTIDGDYPVESNYVLIELDDTSAFDDTFPAGFVGYPIRDYFENSNTSVQAPTLTYKQTYGTFENKRKAYLGLSDIIGIDQDFFDYKGRPDSTIFNTWTGLTHGFHMDVTASAVTIDNVNIVIDSTGGTYSPIFLFDTGNAEFQTDADLIGTDYENIRARKFTLVPYGGYDAWDIYRSRRTNTDTYRINGSKGQLGLTSGAFANRATSTGEAGITSDYYAYFEGIRTFSNPKDININVFATPGIDTFDNTNLIEEAIEMIEVDRGDSLYIVTTPDTDSAGDVLTVDDVVSQLEDQFDSNYTATYWPWIQINDAENNVYIYVPPTRDVVRNIALTDNIAFPWFATAGVQRGDVNAIKARKKITEAEKDTLYEGRVNALMTYPTEGIKIWGNKTLQIKDSALNRINVRRLLLQARKLVAAVSVRLLFEPNDAIVRNQFLSLVNPILDNIRRERGITDFRVKLDNDPEALDRGELCGQIFIKPTKALEFICVEFVLTPNGASFDNI